MQVDAGSRGMRGRVLSRYEVREEPFYRKRYHDVEWVPEHYLSGHYTEEVPDSFSVG